MFVIVTFFVEFFIMNLLVYYINIWTLLLQVTYSVHQNKLLQN